MVNLVLKAASPAVLNHAWRQLKNDRGRWTRRLSMDAMRPNLVRHLAELIAEIHACRYTPEPMRCYEVRKADGGHRLICVASVRDKLVQRAVLTLIEPLGEAIFHPASFAYRPGCTLDMAVSCLRQWVREGYVWIVDADIKGCFDNIPQRAVLKSLKKLCGDR